MVATQEIGQHVLRLPAAALRVDGLEDRDDVFEEELGVVGASVAAVCGIVVRAVAKDVVVVFGRSGSGSASGGVQEGKDLQLAPDPFPRAGDQFSVLCESSGRQGLVFREAVRAHVQRVEVVPVDVSAAVECRVCVLRGGGDGSVWLSGAAVDGSVGMTRRVRDWATAGESRWLRRRGRSRGLVGGWGQGVGFEVSRGAQVVFDGCDGGVAEGTCWPLLQPADEAEEVEVLVSAA